MLSRLFIAALWSPAGKGLTYWLLFVMFIVILLLSHVVSWVRCATELYRFLIFAPLLTFTNKIDFSICVPTLEYFVNMLEISLRKMEKVPSSAELTA